MQIIISFFIWAFLLLQTCFASSPSPYTLESLETKNSIINMRHYSNPDAPVILLLHGIQQGAQAFNEFANQLHQDGFDVWAPHWPGHGPINERSLAKTNPSEHYRFEYLANEYLPAIVRYVTDQVGRKVHMVGYSMGGMVAQVYLGGVEWTGEEFVTKQSLAQERANLVASLTEIGSPQDLTAIKESHFVGLAKLANASLRITSALANGLSFALPQFVQNLAHATEGQLRALLTFHFMIPRGLLNVNNLNSQQMRQLLSHGVQAMPHGLEESMNALLERGHHCFKKNPSGWSQPVYVDRVLLITGEHDEIAPPILTYVVRNKLGRKPKVDFIMVPDTSHVDLIVGQHSAKTIEALEDMVIQLETSYGTIKPISRALGALGCNKVLGN